MPSNLIADGVSRELCAPEGVWEFKKKIPQWSRLSLGLDSQGMLELTL